MFGIEGRCVRTAHACDRCMLCAVFAAGDAEHCLTPDSRVGSGVKCEEASAKSIGGETIRRVPRGARCHCLCQVSESVRLRGVYLYVLWCSWQLGCGCRARGPGIPRSAKLS